MEEKRPQSLAYPSNSITGYKGDRNQNKPIEKPKVQSVVSKPVHIKKKSWIKRTAEKLLADDWADIKSYIWLDTIIPAFKNLIYDMTVGSIEMSLFGTNSTGKRRRADNRNGSVVSYQGYYGNGKRVDSRPSRSQNRSIDDISFATRGEAEEVLSLLIEQIETYGQATVADLYDASGLGSEFTDNDWGWENLASARVNRTRDGYVIILPRPIAIRK